MSSSKSCWNCNKKIDNNAFFCESCKKVQKDFKVNPFKTFSLEKKYEIDLEKLEKRYLELQQLLHPDKFINCSDNEKSFSNSHSSNINNAYEHLKDSVKRIKILLQLEGYIIEDGNKSFKDVSMLEEIMELQNESMSVENERESQKIQLLLKSKIDEEKKKVGNNFLKKKFEDVHKSYIKLSYLEKIIKNLRQ